MSFHIAETQTQLLVVYGGSSSIKFSVFETLADQSLSAGLMARSKALGRRPVWRPTIRTAKSTDRLQVKATPAPAQQSWIGPRRMSAAASGLTGGTILVDARLHIMG